jgi:hypothetical protein
MIFWSELPSDYVLEFGGSDSASSFSGTSEYVLLNSREIPAMKEVRSNFGENFMKRFSRKKVNKPI